MGGAAYRYLHFDVFTNRPFEGNQLAVFLDARGLGAVEMLAIAREMAFSESTFIFPKEDERTDVRMRIFTPGNELPMAGHPTIGSTFALAREGTIASASRRFVFGLGVGPVPVDLEWKADGTLEFAWMTQSRPTFGPVAHDVNGLAEALGVAAADILQTKLPVQEISCGLPFLFVPMATRGAIDRAQLNQVGLAAFHRQAGYDEELPVFLFSPEAGNDDATVYSRMFAPGFGMTEDPATGGASGPLGCYLVRHGVVRPSHAKEIISRQGVKMGRPSRIHVAIGTEGSEITDVKVGGTAVFVGEGTLRV